jgi:acetate---CoA ligase (ADP-forming) subunit beta
MTNSEIRKLLEEWSRDGRRTVHEADTKRILRLAGISVPERSPTQGMTVVKLASDKYPHKTEHGLVQLGVDAFDSEAVGRKMLQSDPDGEILIERMVAGNIAEWIVGCKHDETFGPIVLAGPGGVLVEILNEVEIRLAPADEKTASKMLNGKVSEALLKGARGKPPADCRSLTSFICLISKLFVEHSDLIQEIEVNPIMVLRDGEGVVAADALIVLNQDNDRRKT